MRNRYLAPGRTRRLVSLTLCPVLLLIGGWLVLSHFERGSWQAMLVFAGCAMIGGAIVLLMDVFPGKRSRSCRAGN